MSNQKPKGYPVQQGYLIQQGIPTIQNQPFPAAYPQNYSQQYPQQYHPTQPGHKVVYPTSQSTPLIGDANGVERQKMTGLQHTLQHYQREAPQQQRRRARSETNCCELFCDCENTCCEDCCDGMKSLCVCLAVIGICIAIAAAIIFFAGLF